MGTRKNGRPLLEEIGANLSCWFWRTDAGGVIDYSSDAVFDMLGYRPEELVGSPINRFAAQNECGCLLSQFGKDAAAVTGKTCFNVIFLRKDGSKVSFICRINKITGPSGELTGFTALSIPSSYFYEQQAEIIHAFREKEANSDPEFLRRLYLHLGMTAGADYVLISERDWTRDAKIKSLLVDVNEKKFIENISPLPKFPCEQVMAGKMCGFECGIMENFNIEPLQVLVRSNSYIGVALKDFEGKVVGILAFFFGNPLKRSPAARLILDFFAERIVFGIERKRSAKALGQSEVKYRKLFEMAPMGIVAIDSRGAIVEANKHALDIIGANGIATVLSSYIGEIFFTPGTDSRLLTVDGDACVKFRKERVEFRIKRFDGETIPVESIGAFSQGDLSLLLFQDISERKRAEEERIDMEARLAQMQKMEALGTMAGGVAHDFNNFLMTISGFTEMTLKNQSPGTVNHENLSYVLEASRKARDVVKQILLFTRRISAPKTPIDMSNLIRQTLKLVRASMPSTIEIIEDLARDGECVVFAEPFQIDQIFMNICANARDAMGEVDGMLLVKVGLTRVEGQKAKNLVLPEGSYVKLMIRDTGCGMSAETVARIFEPYYTTKEVGKGSGLGLAVVHGVVKTLNGGIMVQSEPGQGTTFSIYLPYYEVGRFDSPESVEKAASRTHCVMFVDDDIAIARLGEQMLASWGYRVSSFTSSVAALETFRATPESFDLIITDLTMPSLTGKELLKNILETRPGANVILCTGYSDIMDIEQAGMLGAKAFLLKPIDWDNLSRLIAEILSATPKNHF
jgi:PAS domain S-box-containing protein